MTKLADDVLGLIGDTPLVRLKSLAGPNDSLIAGKLESCNPALSIKDRTALGLIEAAERRGALRPGCTVIEATSGLSDVGVLSDAAASCIVSRHAADFLVRASIHHASLLALDAQRSLQTLAARVDRATRDGLDAQQLTAGDVHQVFTLNMYTPALKHIYAKAGFREDQLYLANIARDGHCMSADAAIGLTDFAQHTQFQAPAWLLFQAAGNGYFGSLLLRATPA